MSIKLSKRAAKASDIAPILRGLVVDGSKSMVLNFRTSQKVRAYVSGADLGRYSQLGTVTPDHVIRTKPLPLIVPAPDADDISSFRKGAETAFRCYVRNYHTYFRRNNKIAPNKKIELDPLPRIILVPGLGLFGLGNSAKAAADVLSKELGMATWVDFVRKE